MIESFKRYFNIGAVLEIETSNITDTSRLKLDNSSGNGTRIVWDVTRTNSSSPDTGEVVIYNLSKSQVGAFENAATQVIGQTFNLKISFGWDGQMGELFRGEITKIRAKEITSSDVITRIFFGEKVRSLRKVPEEVIQATDAVWLTTFKLVAQELNCRLSPQFKKAISENPIVFSNNTASVVFGANGNPKLDMDILVNAMGPDYDWVIQDGFIYLLNGGLFQDQTPPQILRASTGLLAYSLQDDGGYQIEALGHPGVRPGQQLILQDENNKTIGGSPLRIESVSWSGDTSSNCTMAISARQPSILA